ILLTASLTTLLAIGSTAAAWTFRRQRNAVQLEQRRTRDNLERALIAERERTAELGRALQLRALALRYSGGPGRRSGALEVLAGAARIARDARAGPEHLAELRDEVIATAALTDDRPVRKWEGWRHRGEVAACCIEADRYVVLGRGGAIHVH